MHKLYFDTCILNDTFPLLQRERQGSVRSRDVKMPLSRWAAEYVALYHLLDLDDQWDLEFGTSEVTLREIARIRPASTLAYEKKAFLEDIADMLYHNFLEKCKAESGPVSPSLVHQVRSLFRQETDAMQISRAIQGRWEFFITTDFRTILVHQSALEEVVFKIHGYQERLWPHGTQEQELETFGIKARSPLQFLEKHLRLPLPTLIRTIYGSWTDPDEFVAHTAEALLALSHH